MSSLLANIDVDDLERGIEFYTRALGLRAARRLEGNVVELLGDSAPIYLLEKPAGSAAAEGLVQPRDYAAVERARAAGARLEGDVGTAKWGHIARMADPFGHGFCLIQFLGRGYDEIAQ
jgi:catechol 2,3-dioxygenase-like lactoylglutathione lyase family enzyme